MFISITIVITTISIISSIVITIIIVISGLVEDVYYRLVGPWIGFRPMTVGSKMQIQV
jgi:hypothetical protein